MEIVYNNTKTLLLEAQKLFNNLKNSKSDMVEVDVLYRSFSISKHCEILNLFVDREPVSSRNNAKIRVDQLKHDNQQLQSAVRTYQLNQPWRTDQETAELLDRYFTIKHQQQRENRGVEQILGCGIRFQVQCNRLISIRNRLTEIFSSLRLSNTTMEYIGKRLEEDRYILYGGMVITIIIIIIVMIYFS